MGGTRCKYTRKELATLRVWGNPRDPWSRRCQLTAEAGGGGGPSAAVSASKPSAAAVARTTSPHQPVERKRTRANTGRRCISDLLEIGYAFVANPRRFYAMQRHQQTRESAPYIPTRVPSPMIWRTRTRAFRGTATLPPTRVSSGLVVDGELPPSSLTQTPPLLRAVVVTPEQLSRPPHHPELLRRRSHRGTALLETPGTSSRTSSPDGKLKNAKHLNLKREGTDLLQNVVHLSTVANQSLDPPRLHTE